MNHDKLRINRPAMLTMPLRDVEALLEQSDGDTALLYLYLLKSGGELDADKARRALRRSDRVIQAAAIRLERMGILTGDVPAPVSDRQLPEYQAEDVVRRSKESPEFQALVEETQAVLGRVLSSADLKKLFGIYDNLALPVEVIMLLIHHCKEENDARYGGQKHLGFAAIEKEAYSWVNREIVTYERAEDWLAELARRKSTVGTVQQAIGIRGRSLSETEQKYVEEWLAMGFGPEAIALAADRTIINTGGLKWPYMNSIVKSWHSKGLHTVEEIEKGDKKAPPKQAEPEIQQTDVKDQERLQRLWDKVKNS